MAKTLLLELEVKNPTRRIVLIRHGQYVEDGDGALTELGRKQAEVTAEALAELRVDAIASSTLLRAKQTADAISARFPRIEVTRSALLCEGIPTPLPASSGYFTPASRVKADRDRADRAFAKLFRPSRSPRLELVVCHGNIIRYFACRAIGVPARAWVNMHSLHCGLTEIAVYPEGDTRLVSYNDTGHLPRALRSMSNAASKRD